MPHLAPMNWLIMPGVVLLLTYFMMIMLNYHQPSCFPSIRMTHRKLISWTWYV